MGFAHQVPALWLFVAVARPRLRALVVFVVLVALSGGAVLAAVAGARRSASSVARFGRAAHEMDAFVTSSEGDNAPLRKLLAGPLVRSFTEVAFTFAGPATENAPDLAIFAPVKTTPSDIEQGVLVQGRRADPAKADEIVLFEIIAKQLKVRAGDTIKFATATPAQGKALLTTGQLEGGPKGPTIPMHVVGIVRNAKDLAAQPGDSNFTFLSPAFLARYGSQVGVGTNCFAVDLVGGPDAVPKLTAQIQKAYAGSVVPGVEAGGQVQAVDDSIAVITRALLIFALVVAVAALAWISTALAREQRRAAEDVAVMRAIGMTNREARVLLAGAFAPALGIGVVLALVVAVLLSPLLPVGLARHVDPDVGLHVDLGALLVGAAVLVVLLSVITWICASRTVATTGRARSQRSSLLVDRVVGWMAPTPGMGARFAFSAPRDGSGRGRPALVGAIVAVVGLVAVSVVATNIDRLLTTPARWGANWDVSIGSDVPQPALVKAAAKDRDIAAAAMGLFDDRVQVGKHGTLPMVLTPIKGTLHPTVIAGREPAAADEVAIGRDTQDAAGTRIGKIVSVRSATERSKFRVVGIMVFPALDQAYPLADGAMFTPQGGARLKLGDPARNDAGNPRLLVRWNPNVNHAAALARLGGGKLDAHVTAAPVEVARLDEARGFPAAIAATLVVLGIIAVSYTLGATVSRRRRELGILSAIGFRPAQRRAVIAVQATSLAVAALIVGIPAGLIVGRVVWSAIATSIGVATDVGVARLQLAIGAVVLVAAFNVMAAVPAWAAGRLRAVDSLRAE